MSKLLEKSNAETDALMAGKTPEEKKVAKAAKDAERYAAKKALAEEKAAAKAEKKASAGVGTAVRHGGKCGALFGFSVVAVMKTAGKVIQTPLRRKNSSGVFAVVWRAASFRLSQPNLL